MQIVPMGFAGGLYAHKPGFQHRLAGLADGLARREVHPDVLTYLAVVCGALGGLALGRSGHSTAVLWLVPPLAAARRVLRFPEGTRSLDGSQRSFKQGVGRLLLETGVPVVPVAILGTHRAWPRGRSVPRRGSVRVSFGQAWRPDPRLTPAEIAEELAVRCCAAAQTPAT